MARRAARVYYISRERSLKTSSMGKLLYYLILIEYLASLVHCPTTTKSILTNYYALCYFAERQRRNSLLFEHPPDKGTPEQFSSNNESNRDFTPKL